MTKTLDTSKPVQLRDGTPARIVSTAMGDTYPIGIIVMPEGGEEYFDSRTFDGKTYGRDVEEGPGDLINVVDTITEFYSIGNGYSDRGAAIRAYGGRWGAFQIVREVGTSRIVSAELV